MIGIFAHPRFYLSMVLTTVTLLLTGSGLAYLLIEAPPRYYRTTYFEWPIPADWDCDTQGTETVCYPDDESQRRTIIITTAKFRGPMDTFEAYKQHLNTPQQLHKSKDGAIRMSQPLYVREIDLGGKIWIDGRHHGSEVENFDTRYMATTTSRLAILVTYSIHEKYFEQYEKILNRIFSQMKIFEPSEKRSDSNP